jgi:hypothetical protein
MENPTNAAALARLQADWPRWQVWIVHRVIGGPVWCARRHDDHKVVLNAGSAEELAEYLEDTVSEPVDDPARKDHALERVILDDPDLMPVTRARLARQFGGRWAIAFDGVLDVWSAERVTGTAIRVLAAREAWELAAKIEAAEAEGRP